MPRTGDRVKETSTSTGTGDITLLGAVSQFQSFADRFGSSSVRVQYAIVGQTGTEWETGIGTFNGTTTIVRDQVRQSSNSDALVNFSAGTKDVFATLHGMQADNTNLGQISAQAAGLAMP